MLAGLGNMADGSQTRSPVGEPAVRKPGWYRDRSTGQRRFWNGVSWFDLAEVITPLPVRSAPRELPPPPAAVETRTPADRRAKLIGASALVVVVALAVVTTIALSGSPPPATPTQATGQAASPSSSPNPTDSVADSTSTSDASTTTAPTPAVAAAPSQTVPLPTTVSTPSSVVPGGRPLVTIVGDSITQFASAAISSGLHRNFTTDIHAVGGTKMSYWTSFIGSVVQSESAHAWIVELGTNDALSSNPTLADDFNNEVTQLAGQQCVVLVTVNPKLNGLADQLDQAMAGAAAQNPNVHLLDWGTIEYQNAKWLVADHIHPTKAGSTALAKLERGALTTDCGL